MSPVNAGHDRDTRSDQEHCPTLKSRSHGRRRGTPTLAGKYPPFLLGPDAAGVRQLTQVRLCLTHRTEPRKLRTAQVGRNPIDNRVRATRSMSGTA